MSSSIWFRLRDRKYRQRSGSVRAGTAILVLGLVLAGCSSVEDSGSVTTTSAEATTTTSQVESTTTEAESVTEVESTTTEDSVSVVDSEGTTTVEASEFETRIEAIPASTLTEAEIEGLLLMREEEKLAHDVYVALHDMWNMRIFSNISEAELTHTDAVRTILERYELDDPAISNPVGVFANPDIQALYDDLVAQGSGSLVDALGVGALIEDLDIFDLRSLATDTPDLALLYDNLEKGSRNHMRAFISQLDKRGETYSPVYLTAAEFDEIISSPTERGHG